MPWPDGARVRPKFEWVRRGAIIRCVVCGRSGYLDGRWQRACLAGHPHRCRLCGRRFATVAGIATHRRHAQSGHDGCPPSPLFLGYRPVLLTPGDAAVS